jgi:iron complex transport system permease protein
MLVLGGTIVSSIFSALISFAKYVADPTDELPSIVFWLMGSLASARYQDILIAGIPMLLGILGLLAVRWRINVLSMGDKEAQTMGLNTRINKGIVIVCATLATAGAVCVSGIIGWVGLVIPHIGRMLVGNDNRVLLPASLSLGACFLILIDNMARMISGSEIPLGILTSLVGGPFFIFLLKRTRGEAGKLETLLAVRNLSFAYNKTDVLTDISFMIQRGEFSFCWDPTAAEKPLCWTAYWDS